MKIRVFDNEASDYCDYEADTVEEIKVLCKERIELPNWKNGHSEVISE